MLFVHRLLLLRLLLLLACLVFVGRLAFLQLLHGDELRKDSERNRHRWVRIAAPRGLILDRKQRVLAANVPGHVAWLVPSEVPRKGWDELATRLTDVGIFPDRDSAVVALDEARHAPSYLPVRLLSGLDIATISRIEEQQAFFPGVFLRDEPLRSYPEGTRAAHLLGYLREINSEEMLARREQGYHNGDSIGKAGLERALEDELRGVEGGQQVDVDVHGRVQRVLQDVAPQPGQSVTLTLDMDLQRAAEDALNGHRGAVVALDPRNGDILALASAPAFDLNHMTGRISTETMKWLRGPDTPELNRATAGQYPPGSVFKIVTAAAVLEKKLIQPNEFFFCDGSYHGIGCSKRSGHGSLTFTEAMAQSCNVAFMKMAERVGIMGLAHMARRFGLGQATRVLPESETVGKTTKSGLLPEADGVVPDPQWERTKHHRPWEFGETLQVGIGQSSLAITPLQGARIIAAIANGGQLIHPRLVQRIGEYAVPGEAPDDIGLSADTVQRIAEGLRAVVAEGTAKKLDPELHIAGKTGTAQNPGGEDHAWFVGYAPREDPKIAVAVLIEHGGHGGAVAAPIAQTLIRVALQGPPPVAEKGK